MENIIGGISAMMDSKFSGNYSPLQNKYNAIRMLEPLVTKELQEINDYLGVSFSGIEYSVKTASSIEDKLKRMQVSEPDADIGSLFGNFKDLIRYTQITKHDDIFKTVKDTIRLLKEKGYMLTKVNNYYESPFPRTGYKGLHLNFLTPYGQAVEVQVHSEESFKAKQEGHALYEKIRAVATPLKEKERLSPLIKQVHGSVPNPADYKKIPSFTASSKDVLMYLSTLHPLDIKMKYASLPQESVDIISCQISLKGKELLNSNEIHQSDNSVVAIRAFNGENEGIAVAITPQKEIVSSEKIKYPQQLRDIHASSKLLRTAGVVNERNSREWENGAIKINKNNKDIISIINKAIDVLKSKEEER